MNRNVPKLEKFLKKTECMQCCRNLKLESFLIMPIQRLPRYILLLKELQKYTHSQHPDYEHIAAALEVMGSLASKLNESQRMKESSDKINEIKSEVRGAQLPLESLFIFEGALMCKTEKVNTTPKMLVKLHVRRASLQLEQSHESKWAEVFVYLFRDMMLCAKKLGKNNKRGQNSSNTLMRTVSEVFHGKGYYKFSQIKAIPLANMELKIENDDTTKFTVTSEKEVHEFKVLTAQAWVSWMDALEKTDLSIRVIM